MTKGKQQLDLKDSEFQIRLCCLRVILCCQKIKHPNRKNNKKSINIYLKKNNITELLSES
jgi:hypothetical protein